MPLLTNTPPTTSIAGKALEGRRPSEPVQRSTPSDPPKKAADQLAASLQSKETKRGVSADRAKTVGGAKGADEQRLDRSPEKGIDKVSISAQLLEAAKSSSPESKPKAGKLDSAVEAVIDGAVGRFAGLPKIDAEDPTRAGKDAAVIGKTTRPGQKAPESATIPLFSRGASPGTGTKG